jgi:hypothetical protein
MKGAKVGDSFECVDREHVRRRQRDHPGGRGRRDPPRRDVGRPEQGRAAILKGVLTNVTAAAEAYTAHESVAIVGA